MTAQPFQQRQPENSLRRFGVIHSPLADREMPLSGVGQGIIEKAAIEQGIMVYCPLGEIDLLQVTVDQVGKSLVGALRVGQNCRGRSGVAGAGEEKPAINEYSDAHTIPLRHRICPQDSCQPMITGGVAYFFKGRSCYPFYGLRDALSSLSASLGSVSFQVVQLFGIPSSVHTLDPSAIPIFRHA